MSFKTVLICTCQEWLAVLPSKELLSLIQRKPTYFDSFQVLHLMNKMNLPPPFGPITARPPMVTF